MENGFFTVDYESMAGVVTTLVRRRCYPFFKITVCLKMDSTIAFSELQHFLHPK